MDLVTITLRWFFLLFFKICSRNYVVQNSKKSLPSFIFILALKLAPIHFQLRSKSVHSPISNYLDTGDLTGGGRLIKLCSGCC